jgi:hypothetical protein
MSMLFLQDRSAVTIIICSWTCIDIKIVAKEDFYNKRATGGDEIRLSSQQVVSRYDLQFCNEIQAVVEDI